MLKIISKFKQLMIYLGGLIMVLFIAGCSSTAVNYYKDKTPVLNLQSYLNGDIEGSGIIKDWRGRVVKQFEFIATASWDGDTATLDEHMIYYDGKKDHRIWTIKKINDKLYEGTADDVIGKATIYVDGNAMNWQYTMDITVDGSTYRINFDDWMYLMHNGVLINENKFKKFGFTVGSLTLFMKKKNVSEVENES